MASDSHNGAEGALGTVAALLHDLDKLRSRYISSGSKSKYPRPSSVQLEGGSGTGGPASVQYQPTRQSRAITTPHSSTRAATTSPGVAAQRAERVRGLLHQLTPSKSPGKAATPSDACRTGAQRAAALNGQQVQPRPPVSAAPMQNQLPEAVYSSSGIALSKVRVAPPPSPNEQGPAYDSPLAAGQGTPYKPSPQPAAWRSYTPVSGPTRTAHDAVTPTTAGSQPASPMDEQSPSMQEVHSAAAVPMLSAGEYVLADLSFGSHQVVVTGQPTLHQRINVYADGTVTTVHSPRPMISPRRLDREYPDVQESAEVWVRPPEDQQHTAGLPGSDFSTHRPAWSPSLTAQDAENSGKELAVDAVLQVNSNTAAAQHQHDPHMGLQVLPAQTEQHPVLRHDMQASTLPAHYTAAHSIAAAPAPAQQPQDPAQVQQAQREQVGQHAAQHATATAPPTPASDVAASLVTPATELQSKYKRAKRLLQLQQLEHSRLQGELSASQQAQAAAQTQVEQLQHACMQLQARLDAQPQQVLITPADGRLELQVHAAEGEITQLRQTLDSLQKAHAALLAAHDQSEAAARQQHEDQQQLQQAQDRIVKLEAEVQQSQQQLQQAGTVIQQLQDLVQQQGQQMQELQLAAQEQLSAALQQAQQEAAAQLEQLISEQGAKLMDAELQHVTSRREMENQHAAALQQMKTAHAHDLQSQQAHSDAVRQSVQAQHAQAVAELHASHSAALGRAAAEHRDALHQLEKGHQVLMDATQERYNRRLAGIQSEARQASHDVELRTLQQLQAAEDQVQQLQAQVQQLQAQVQQLQAMQTESQEGGATWMVPPQERLHGHKTAEASVSYQEHKSETSDPAMDAQEADEQLHPADAHGQEAMATFGPQSPNSSTSKQQVSPSHSDLLSRLAAAQAALLTERAHNRELQAQVQAARAGLAMISPNSKHSTGSSASSLQAAVQQQHEFADARHASVQDKPEEEAGSICNMHGSTTQLQHHHDMPAEQVVSSQQAVGGDDQVTLTLPAAARAAEQATQTVPHAVSASEQGTQIVPMAVVGETIEEPEHMPVTLQVQVQVSSPEEVPAQMELQQQLEAVQQQLISKAAQMDELQRQLDAVQEHAKQQASSLEQQVDQLGQAWSQERTTLLAELQAKQDEVAALQQHINALLLAKSEPMQQAGPLQLQLPATPAVQQMSGERAAPPFSQNTSIDTAKGAAEQVVGAAVSGHSVVQPQQQVSEVLTPDKAVAVAATQTEAASVSGLDQQHVSAVSQPCHDPTADGQLQHLPCKQPAYEQLQHQLEHLQQQEAAWVAERAQLQVSIDELQQQLHAAGQDAADSKDGMLQAHTARDSMADELMATQLLLQGLQQQIDDLQGQVTCLIALAQEREDARLVAEQAKQTTEQELLLSQQARQAADARVAELEDCVQQQAELCNQMQAELEAAMKAAEAEVLELQEEVQAARAVTEQQAVQLEQLKGAQAAAAADAQEATKRHVAQCAELQLQLQAAIAKADVAADATQQHKAACDELEAQLDAARSAAADAVDQHQVVCSALEADLAAARAEAAAAAGQQRAARAARAAAAAAAAEMEQQQAAYAAVASELAAAKADLAAAAGQQRSARAARAAAEAAAAELEQQKMAYTALAAELEAAKAQVDTAVEHHRTQQRALEEQMESAQKAAVTASDQLADARRPLGKLPASMSESPGGPAAADSMVSQMLSCKEPDMPSEIASQAQAELAAAGSRAQVKQAECEQLQVRVQQLEQLVASHATQAQLLQSHPLSPQTLRQALAPVGTAATPLEHTAEHTASSDSKPVTAGKQVPATTAEGDVRTGQLQEPQDAALAGDSMQANDLLQELEDAKAQVSQLKEALQHKTDQYRKLECALQEMQQQQAGNVGRVQELDKLLEDQLADVSRQVVELRQALIEREAQVDIQKAQLQQQAAQISSLEAEVCDQQTQGLVLQQGLRTAEAESAQVQQRLSNARAECGKLQQELSTTEAECARLRQHLAAMEQQTGGHTQELQQLRAAHEQALQEIEQLEEELAQVAAQFNQQQANVADELKAVTRLCQEGLSGLAADAAATGQALLCQVQQAAADVASSQQALLARCLQAEQQVHQHIQPVMPPMLTAGPMPHVLHQMLPCTQQLDSVHVNTVMAACDSRQQTGSAVVQLGIADVHADEADEACSTPARTAAQQLHMQQQAGNTVAQVSSKVQELAGAACPTDEHLHSLDSNQDLHMTEQHDDPHCGPLEASDAILQSRLNFRVPGSQLVEWRTNDVALHETEVLQAEPHMQASQQTSAELLSALEVAASAQAAADSFKQQLMAAQEAHQQAMARADMLDASLQQTKAHVDSLEQQLADATQQHAKLLAELAASTAQAASLQLQLQEQGQRPSQLQQPQIAGGEACVQQQQQQQQRELLKAQVHAQTLQAQLEHSRASMMQAQAAEKDVRQHAEHVARQLEAVQQQLQHQVDVAAELMLQKAKLEVRLGSLKAAVVSLGGVQGSVAGAVEGSSAATQQLTEPLSSNSSHTAAGTSTQGYEHASMVDTIWQHSDTADMPAGEEQQLPAGLALAGQEESTLSHAQAHLPSRDTPHQVSSRVEAERARDQLIGGLNQVLYSPAPAGRQQHNSAATAIRPSQIAPSPAPFAAAASATQAAQAVHVSSVAASQHEPLPDASTGHPSVSWLLEISQVQNPAPMLNLAELPDAAGMTAVQPALAGHRGVDTRTAAEQVTARSALPAAARRASRPAAASKQAQHMNKAGVAGTSRGGAQADRVAVAPQNMGSREASRQQPGVSTVGNSLSTARASQHSRAAGDGALSMRQIDDALQAEMNILLEDIASHVAHISQVDAILDSLEQHCTSANARVVHVPPSLRQLVSPSGLQMLQQLHTTVVLAQREVARVQRLLGDNGNASVLGAAAVTSDPTSAMHSNASRPHSSVISSPGRASAGAGYRQRVGYASLRNTRPQARNVTSSSHLDQHQAGREIKQGASGTANWRAAFSVRATSFYHLLQQAEVRLQAAMRSVQALLQAQQPTISLDMPRTAVQHGPAAMVAAQLRGGSAGTNTSAHNGAAMALAMGSDSLHSGAHATYRRGDEESGDQQSAPWQASLSLCRLPDPPGAPVLPISPSASSTQTSPQARAPTWCGSQDQAGSEGEQPTRASVLRLSRIDQATLPQDTRSPRSDASFASMRGQPPADRSAHMAMASQAAVAAPSQHAWSTGTLSGRLQAAASSSTAGANRRGALQHLKAVRKLGAELSRMKGGDGNA